MPQNPLETPTPWHGVAQDYHAQVAPALFQLGLAALSQFEISRDHSLLELGCGPGLMTLELAPQVSSLTAIDFAPAMVALASQAVADASLKHVTVQEADACDLPFQASQFDRLVGLFTAMFFADRPKAFREMARVLRPEGRVLLTTWPAQQSDSAIGFVGSRLSQVLIDDSAAPQGGPLADAESTRRDLVGSRLDLERFWTIDAPIDMTDPASFMTSYRGGDVQFHMLDETLSDAEVQQFEAGLIRELTEVFTWPRTELLSANAMILVKSHTG